MFWLTTNTNRVADALSPLKPNALLELAAQEKANDMAANGYFAHTSPSGLTPWYWFQKVGYNFTYAGENLAVNFTDSEDVINAWMNSPSHRENILNGNFTEIGIATAQGTYNGKSAVFAVQLFGTPAPVVAYVPPKPVAQAGAPGAGSAVNPAAPVVLGESSSSNRSGESTFIAVKGAGEAAVSPSAKPAAAAPAEISSETANILASPRKTVDYVFYAAVVFVVLALALNIFIKIRIQHGYLILNGLYLLVFLTAMLVFNHYLTAQQIIVL